MTKFFKKQFIKLLIYIIILGLITILFFSRNWDKNTLLSVISLITSIFIAFMGKTWIDDYKLEIDRELENHKLNINKELESYKTKLSGYTLVTKLQYDLEFKIYTEISEKIFLLYVETQTITDSPFLPTIIKEKLEKISNTYNMTSNLINKYKPFYPKEIYNLLIETRNLCYKETKEFEENLKTNLKNFNIQLSEDRIEKIGQNIDNISELIRKRIENMKIIED
ncbi:hypothetical protein I6E36_12995 [Fusobacterium mortiferum]|uniref:hypothetical protein n=1 Tax=Fusobacterium mortiferum TaxID=850 RepID=UPI001F3FFF7D|nr:hypothetical protein [Fusobacterium mortiferum]MCF2628996.1 hypothetical protein [Fusobacterium mortiferum]